jgi:magnesium-transporting ATPase (P-type)
MDPDTGVLKEVQCEPSGNKTEIALLKFIDKCKSDSSESYTQLRKSFIPKDGICYEFSSTRKRMSTQIKCLDGGNDILLMKGGSEYMINACTSVHFWGTNKIEPMTEQNGLKEKILCVIKNLNGKSLRTLGLCYKHVYNMRELGGEPDK